MRRPLLGDQHHQLGLELGGQHIGPLGGHHLGEAHGVRHLVEITDRLRTRLAYGPEVVAGTPSPPDEAPGIRDATPRRPAPCAAARSRSTVLRSHAPEGVVVLAGASGSGKSTLAAAATLHGWGYVADEVAAVDPATLVASPYHRPIGLRRQGAEALGLPFPPGRTVPGDAVDWPVDPARHSPGGTVRLIALVLWDPDAPTTCDEVAPAQAMVELMQHLVVHDEHVAWCFRAVETIVRTVPVVRLTYADPPAGLAHLAEYLDADA